MSAFVTAPTPAQAQSPYPSPPADTAAEASSSSASAGGNKWKNMFKGGSTKGHKGKERAGLEGVFGTPATPTPEQEHPSGSTSRPGPYERSMTEPSYFPPQTGDQDQTQTQQQNQRPTQPPNQAAPGLTLTPLHDDAPTPGSAQPPSASASGSGEQSRSYSLQTDTDADHDPDRSSHSSSSRSRANGNGYDRSSASLYLTNSSHLPPRSPGGLGGFKARFFSNPSSVNALNNTGAGPTQQQDGATPSAKGGKVSASSSSHKKSVGSLSSPTHSAQPSPRTPSKTGKYRDKLLPPPTDKENSPSPLKGATRWLRRVVSAPNTKALFGPGSSSGISTAGPVPNGDGNGSGYTEADPPPVPPMPHSAAALAHGPPSPVIVVSPTHTHDSDGQQSSSPTKTSPTRNTPSPHKPPIASSLNPTAGHTRGLRAQTVSSGTKAKDIQAQLGIGLKESHHKQVFRRTYSSNSIKTRSVSISLFHVTGPVRECADKVLPQVEVTPSSFQKIKLLGKGDVGKVYLVKEKKTDKLFAMKGGSAYRFSTQRLARSNHRADMLLPDSTVQEGNDQAQQDQACSRRAGNPGHFQPSLYRHPIPFLPIARLPLFRP